MWALSPQPPRSGCRCLPVPVPWGLRGEENGLGAPTKPLAHPCAWSRVHASTSSCPGLSLRGRPSANLDRWPGDPHRTHLWRPQAAEILRSDRTPGGAAACPGPDLQPVGWRGHVGRLRLCPCQEAAHPGVDCWQGLCGLTAPQKSARGGWLSAAIAMATLPSVFLLPSPSPPPTAFFLFCEQKNPRLPGRSWWLGGWWRGRCWSWIQGPLGAVGIPCPLPVASQRRAPSGPRLSVFPVRELYICVFFG